MIQLCLTKLHVLDIQCAITSATFGLVLSGFYTKLVT